MFDGRRTGRGKERLDERKQFLVELRAFGDAPLEKGLDHPSDAISHDVASDAYHAVTAHAEDWKREAIVAAVHAKARRDPRANVADLSEVAARFLDGDDVGVSASRSSVSVSKLIADRGWML
ncbi:MAG: hypothetical protein UZ18_ATM001000846 [Armatimonadetes bacterium OLB18]|nr:MAG: hypothetical protein UZ18_ATM001000846 [Armatimonadetes bacterium OLB18]